MAHFSVLTVWFQACFTTITTFYYILVCSDMMDTSLVISHQCSVKSSQADSWIRYVKYTTVSENDFVSTLCQPERILMTFVTAKTSRYIHECLMVCTWVPQYGKSGKLIMIVRKKLQLKLIYKNWRKNIPNWFCIRCDTKRHATEICRCHCPFGGISSSVYQIKSQIMCWIPHSH